MATYGAYPDEGLHPATDLYPGDPTLNQQRTAAGTLTLSGTATGVAVHTVTAAGTLVLSGTADADIVGETPVRTALGSLALGGSAAGVPVQSRTASGSLELSSSAVGIPVQSRTAVGVLTLSGIGFVGSAISPPTVPSMRSTSRRTLTPGTVRRTIRAVTRRLLEGD